MTVGAGRPLRFLGLVAGGWVAMRVAVAVQGGASVATAIEAIVPLPRVASAAAPRIAGGIVPPAEPVDWGPPLRLPRTATSAVGPVAIAAGPAAATVRGAAPDPAVAPFAQTSAARAEILPPAPPLPATPLARTRTARRLSVSSWMIARTGFGAGDGAVSPQLGGTQGGVRVDYALTPGIAATARLAAPATGIGRELSVGIAWRPRGVPLRIVAEQRIALDGGRSGPSASVSGGVDAVRLPAGFRLEGYGQAGVVVRGSAEAFVDGSARATRPLGAIGDVALDAGVGTWGGAQRGVARVDVGPTLGARIPVFGQRLRIAADWRHRIAGNARPASGPALTMGLDF